MNERFQRIWIQLTADRKRFGILVACLAVGLLFWARMIVISRPPQKAVANDRSAKVSSANEAAAGAGRPSDSAPRTTVQIVLPRGLTRDPFRVNPHYFPRPTPQTTEAKEVVQLPTNSADEQERAMALRTAQLREHASNLTLEAVLRGGMAVINGRTVMLGASFKAGRNGEVVFTLVEIGDRSVIVEAEGRQFELRMSLGANPRNNN